MNSGNMFASLVIGGATFCFFYFLTEDKDYKDHDKAFAAIKYGAIMFVISAAFGGLFLS